MTCIVGVKTGTGVLLGADSLGVTGHAGRVRADPKVFRFSSEVAVGFTWSYRMGQILQYHLTLPKLRDRATSLRIDEYAWAVTQFIPAAQKAWAEHGWLKVEHERQEAGQFLLAVGARLFTVESDLQVEESSWPFAACGSGATYALGALHALAGETQGPSAVDAMEAALCALRAAEEYTTTVRGPFVFVETERSS